MGAIMQRNPLFLLRLLAILNLMLLIQSHPSLAASPEKRVALVIGNSAYQNTPPLANPRNDATEMGKALKRVGFDVDLVVDATKPDMDQALRRFGNNLTGSSAAVFYYAGHGIQVDGINYILPVDVALKNERDLNWETSDMTTVLKQMEGHNRVNLLFLDACRDNPLSQTLARSMGESRSSVIGRGLATMKANAGTLISYSTKEGEVAADGKGKHSPYTEALLKHIEMPGIEIGLLLRKVREEVISATKNKQVPWEYGSLLGEFYFTGPVTVQVQPEVSKSATGSKNESLYWESIMNDTDPAAFEEYLKKYPDGEFSGLARYKINSLKKGGKKLPQVDVIPQIEQIKPSGSLNISSDPSDAMVVLDGNPIGHTDMEISGIDVGKRKIEIKKDCFETKTVEVFINSNQQLKLNLKLKPSCGAISVISNPIGADIFMDEKLVGVTPAELTELKPGTHTISLKKEGYEEWKDTATVRAVKTVLIKADLLMKAAVVAKPPAQQPTIEIVPPVVAKPPAQQTTTEIIPPVAAKPPAQQTTTEIIPPVAAKPPAQQPATEIILPVAEHKIPELHFTVEATPPDSRINILNIQGKYQKGMVLKPGKYQVEVLRDGYETSTQWITMDQSDIVLPVVLMPLQKENLRVTGEPSDADVLIDKKPADSVPVELSGVSTGNQQTTVKKPDHDETVAVQAGKTTSATGSLKQSSKYTKLDVNGKQLPNSTQSWMMVLDNETSLIWEVKQNKDGINNYDNPNDADNKYLSYESDKKFIKVLNAANWGGFSDWRVPSKEELDTLVDSKGTKRTINTAYFPNTQSSSYWSSGGERVDFGSSPDYGYGSNRDVSDSKDHGGYVRAVRGGK